MSSKYSGVFNSFIGWGISTLLLWLFYRHNRSGSDTSTSQTAANNTTNNTNTIGNPVPFVLGRGMIKNPLVSYYGDFSYKIYTEEYGMHTKFNWASLIPSVVFAILALCSKPTKVVGTVQAGPYTGEAVTLETTDDGLKRQKILMVIVSILLQLLTALFTRHMGRTTIQKGFKYYLGWQHIICWSGEKVGFKKLWMQVYDTKLEQSTEKGVWDNDNHIAWREENKTGISTYINNQNMFGGVDEGGGFEGHINLYLGGKEQPKDPWMIEQMKNKSVEESLRGLTPQYPMYVSCVIPTAYIGKQATIPEMWFEIVNYPTTLGDAYKDYLKKVYDDKCDNSQKIIDKITAIPVKERTKVEEITLNSAEAYLKTLQTHGVYTLGKLGEDLNPAEAIYEILTNSDWGCDYTKDRIDVQSLVDLGITCEEEGLGVSIVGSYYTTAESYIAKILEHVNGVKYDEPVTGKLTFKLIRNDYEVKDLPIFDESNCVSCKFSRLDWSNTLTAVSANFTDAEHKYITGQLTQQDVANVRITHNNVEKSIDATYFTTAQNAKIMAQTQLLSGGYPLASITLETNRTGYNITAGHPIIVTWNPYGLSKVVFRVTDIDYGSLTSGNIKITAIEDIFGFDTVKYGVPSGMEWIVPENTPYDVDRYTYLELPYELSMSKDTYLYALASQPSGFTIVWDVWRQVNGVYERTAQSTQWCMSGKLVYPLEEEYLEDNTNGIEIRSETTTTTQMIDDKIERIEEDPDTYTNRSYKNLLLLGTEIISYNTITKLPNGNYKLNGIIRGCFDTLPKAHNTETIAFFLDYYLNVVKGNRRLASAGVETTQNIAILSETQDRKQEFSQNKVTQVQTKRRAEAPSVMNNMKFAMDKGKNTTYEHNFPSTKLFSGNLLFTFIPKNKFFSQTIRAQDEDSSDVLDTNVINVIDILSGRVNFTIKKDIEEQDSSGNVVSTKNMELTWSEYCKNMDNQLEDANTVNLTIHTYDTKNDVYSYDSYERMITYKVPRLTGIFTSKSDLDDYLKKNCTINSIIVPECSVAPQMAFTYDECPLVAVGTSTTTGILAQDGNQYTLTNVYQIIGAQEVVEIDMRENEYYVLSSNFTTLEHNTRIYYQNISGEWNAYSIHN